ncbi:hypothetical protein [Streptomyces sp. bgisy100]|uniref:hypothetical protein n=1 Tax=Streptomyces sp. bgisy100 TaxID=3413783 RepID=UPI003D755A2C
MSDLEPLPQRTPKRTLPDRLRRASLADAAGGFDGLSELGWLRLTGGGRDAAALAWDRGMLARVPVGYAWDVVRFSRHEGIQVLRQLRTLGITIGPVLQQRSHIKVFVPTGSVDDWDLPGAFVLRHADHVDVPHPAVVSPHSCDGCSWITPPRNDLALTDGADLYGAFAAVRATSTYEGR